MKVLQYCLGIVFSSIGHIGEVLIKTSFEEVKGEKKNRIGF